ncbi:MAG: nucleotidyl transferase AbiEii/AbiGii toxin family protein [Candidatus Pacebacteria bacterium]|jgi:predicted nucleotidyltransferase component of viral defense system|nr:nucleotidyl transferase AbiEii/AbiGii toxin family protein [Candidatus Paceibacterota bacterium]MBT4005320.1 nucleotidyl transferase AbiEii/AbiGii toxin family protein [Candidatus Paceibacterota bacterium]MBT4358384.1 nucleotidyl transferase AbiEii/AbiGii toxin family protein [Candidatus Paceibacterota bacterium]MBT4681266.1 nucleotidyl transferase AbiEii/AbiGii toxin family protein [Candidatus Paceibacterota bacterium]MBT6898676.1 nucleotidyl transferase AbiEii/AbiGii toxin family protein [
MLDKAHHRQVMFEILQEVYQSSIGKLLGFKGGTMLYFFEELDRFSVDLDFDLLETEKVGQVRQVLHEIIKKYGQITEEREKKQTLIFILNYKTGQHSLKIEISKRVDQVTSYEWRNFYGVDVQTMQLEDALAHKLVAATERRGVANRDFYDIWFLLKRGVRANPAVIKKRTDQDLGQYLDFLIKFIDKNFKLNQVTVGLGELLDRSKRDWVKVKLKDELLGKLEFYLDEFRQG